MYIYRYGDDVDEVLKVKLDRMVEYQDGLEEAIQVRRNLEEMHMKIRENVNIKLAKYLEPLLEVPSADKYHWWFALIIDSCYVNEFTYVRKLYEIDTFDTRTIINEIIPKFYDYIVAEELSENPCTTPPDVSTSKCSLYLNEDTLWEPITSSKGDNTLIQRVESEFKVFCNAEAAHTAINNEDVLTWYKENQNQFPMLSCLATIFFSIPPPQAENERNFSLAEIYSSTIHTRMSVDMILSLLFINRHSRLTPPEKYI